MTSCHGNGSGYHQKQDDPPALHSLFYLSKVILLKLNCFAGHDEDPAKAALGTPLERIMKMGVAMLEAVRSFKPPSADGKKFEIRLGQYISCLLSTISTTLHTKFERPFCNAGYV